MFERRIGLAVVLACVVAGPARAAAPFVDTQPLPKDALRRLGMTRLRHEGHVYQLAFSSDGKTLASASSDQTVRIWDAATGEERGRISCAESAFAVAFSPDGQTLALAGGHGGIHLHDLHTLRHLRQLSGHKDYVTGLSFSPDGKTLLSGSADKTVRLWDVAAGKQRHCLEQHHDWVCAVAFSPDGKRFASTSDDRMLIWDLKTLKVVNEVGSDGGRGLCFSGDGKFLARDGNPVRIVDAASGQTLRAFRGHKWWHKRVALSADGATLVVGGRQTEVWDLKKGELRHELGGHVEGVNALALSPDGKTLATATAQAVRLWDVATGRERSASVGHQRSVSFVALSDNGRLVATGDQGSAWLWAARSGKLLQRLGGDDEEVRPLAFARDGKTLATFGGESGRESVPAPRNGVQFWKIDASRKQPLEAKQLVEVEGHGWVSPDLRSVLSWQYVYKGGYSDVEVRDLASKKKAVTLEESFFSRGSFGVPSREIAASRDGRFIAMGQSHMGFGAPARLWYAATGKERPLSEKRERAAFERVSALAFSDDGARLAVGWSDGLIERFETATGRAQTPLKGHEKAVNALAFSPDGRTLVSAGLDGTVRLWELATSKERHRFVGHRGSVNAVAFGGRGRIVVSGGSDTTVLLWATWPEGRSSAKLSDKERDALWADLGSPDATKAFRAARALAERLEQAAALLRPRLRPVAPPSKDVAHLIEGLDHDDFDVRQRSEAALEALGDRVADDLRRTLAASSSEVAVRVKRLLDKLNAPPSGELLRALRAIEVLEHAPSAEARDLLKVISQGAKGARVTQAAAESLRRIESGRQR